MVGSLHSARVLPTRSHHSCIPELEAALSDPSTNVPSTIPQLLADLHTRTDLGVLPPYPTDDASKPEWNARSEEHTSELQSRSDLVCRLLLEKKKKKKTNKKKKKKRKCEIITHKMILADTHDAYKLEY